MVEFTAEFSFGKFFLPFFFGNAPKMKNFLRFGARSAKISTDENAPPPFSEEKRF